MTTSTEFAGRGTSSSRLYSLRRGGVALADAIGDVLCGGRIGHDVLVSKTADESEQKR
jgi:hypothetical protein